MEEVKPISPMIQEFKNIKDFNIKIKNKLHFFNK